MSGRSFKSTLRRLFTGAPAHTQKRIKIPKIICTLGTTTDDEYVLQEMITEGMACARINTAYADIGDYKKRIDALRRIAKIPVVLDLKGSQIRIATDQKYSIAQGMEFPVGFGRGSISFNYDFHKEIFPGDLVLFENGTIKMVVAEKKKNYVMLRVLEAGEGYLTNHMGANIPGKVFTSIPPFTLKDKDVVAFGLKEHVEVFAVSFVRSSQDVFALQKIIESNNASYQPEIKIKIEDLIGIENLESIIRDVSQRGIAVSVMIGRGDLFVEAPRSQLALLQKKIITSCRDHGVSVDVATGLLESMQHSPYPTRAEVADVTNAILDGADWLMLSGETSNSRYPVAAVRMLSHIIREVAQF